MKKRILVLGRKGMLGSMLYKVLSHDPSLEVIGTSRDPKDPYCFDVDSGVKSLDKVAKRLDLVVNCIGIRNDLINVDDNLSVERATQINSLFPHELAKWVEARKTHLIHMSTDGIFSGRAQSCDEKTTPDCADVYGKTKLGGEVLHDRVVNIRCSVLGPSPYYHKGLYEWFMAQPAQFKIAGFTNHHWNGVTTLQFAQLISAIIRQDVFQNLRKESAVFHFCPNEMVTKWELLEILNQVYKRNMMITPVVADLGAVKRVLTSRFQGLKQLVKHDISMQEAIVALQDFEKSSTYSGHTVFGS